MKSLSVVTAGLVLGLPQTLAAPSKAQIKWGKCNLPWGKATDAALYGETECATLKAPLDYTKPDNGKTIDLQLARVKAKVQPAKGSVFYNPGGPGNSAVEYLVTGTEDYYQVLGGQYNLVAVDPRGTGRTLPFNCTIEEEDGETESSKSKLSRRFDVLPQANTWPQVKGETWDSLGEKAERCYKARKETGAFIGTAFSARDIMTAVDALGEDGMLRYWGISYGTVLGQTLAGMFPDRIDRMVLDGNVMIDEYVMGLNPSLVKDTERSMLHLIDECVKSGPELCPLAGWAGSNTTVEILTVAIEEVWTDLLKVSKIPESWGLPEDASFFQGGVSFLERIKNHIQQQLYAPSNFGDLAAFIEKMIDEEWAEVYEIMYPSSDEEEEEEEKEEEEEVTEVWNWGEDALDGIYCGDQAYRAETVNDLYSAWALHSEQSSFSDTGASSELTCARWPFKAAETIDMNKFKHVNTKMPILFVNSRYDPITPLVSAYEASTRFNGSRVVVHEGEGHGIHGNPSVCTYTAIIDYFKNGRLPKPGVSCPVKTPVFQMLWEQQEAARNATESE